jgi:hypothetical protein
VRSALRWSSLVAAVVVLAVVGEARLHLHDFTRFLLVLLAVAAGVTAMFLVTRDRPPG